MFKTSSASVRIRVLRRHGMNNQALQAVYRSVVLAKLLYASGAWRGFTTADDRHRIEAFLRRGMRAGLCPASNVIRQLSERK